MKLRKKVGNEVVNNNKKFKSVKQKHLKEKELYQKYRVNNIKDVVTIIDELYARIEALERVLKGGDNV